MKVLLRLSLRLRWLNLPAAVLLTLLQRTPALRVAATAGEFVLASPLGAVLKSAAATAAALGAVHSLAGATQFVASANPINGTVGIAITNAVVTVNGAQTPAGSFRILSGALPAGLTIPGLNPGTNVVNGISLTITGTPTTAGTSSILLRAYEFADAKGDFFPQNGGYTVTFNISAGAATAPVFTAQPQSATVNAGTSVTFTAAASGSPAPTWQWRKDGVNIAGATSASLTIASVQSSDAGSYTVVATNAAGTATSTAATLTVNPAVAAPTFVAQPVPQTIAPGSTVVFSATATGATSYQWRKNGATIPGATRALLVIPAATAADAGTYSVMAINPGGATPSQAAALAVNPTNDPGRLINLSILTPLAAGESMTLGTVLGGANTTGTKPLLVRAVGPSLATFGLTAFLPAPTLTLNYTTPAPAQVVASAAAWNGDATLSSAFAAVGAFPFANAATKDSAIYRSGLQPGNYTVEVRDTGNGSGTVIAELYDSTPANSFSASTPRLVNVAVLKGIAADSTLTAGFVIGGSTAKTVLIRAIGPGLAAVGVTSGTMADPQLTLNSTSVSPAVVVATNNDWGADSAIAATGNSIGAFPIGNSATKDAMLLVTLAPGNYTAEVSAVPGTAGGTAIVEVYEVP